MTGKPFSWLPSPSVDMAGLAKASRDALGKVDVTYDNAGADGRKIPLMVLKPKKASANAFGVLWIHGGGYVTGMKEMALFSRAVDLVEKFGCTVVSPGYRLAPIHPYPAALDDCYDALLWLKDNAQKLDVRTDKFIVGGESAGGGLCAAVCMRARDFGDVDIALQLPLYPMIDNLPTKTNVGNHGKVWNSTPNNFAWKAYLRSIAKPDCASAYAAPARQIDYENLPPCYTFVGTGEPFYAETCSYVSHLRDAGVEAVLDIYDTDVHAFDMVHPDTELANEAAAHFCDRLSDFFETQGLSAN